MNRGSGEGLGIAGAQGDTSMRPRFMNRGSPDEIARLIGIPP